MSLDEILRDLERVYAGVREASGVEFGFDREDRHAHENSYTFYLRYNGPLPAGGAVKVDITIRERLVFPLENRPVLRAYEEFADLPAGRVVRTYSLAEIMSEKVVALADRARNEPRDLYDLWYLISCGDTDLASLAAAVSSKLAFRNMHCRRPSGGDSKKGSSAKGTLVRPARKSDGRVAPLRPGLSQTAPGLAAGWASVGAREKKSSLHDNL